MSKAKQPLDSLCYPSRIHFCNLEWQLIMVNILLFYFYCACQTWNVTGIFFLFRFFFFFYRHLFCDAQQAFCSALLTSFHRCLNPLILSRKIQEFILLPPTSLSIMLSVYTTETVEMSFQWGRMKHLWSEGTCNLKMHCPAWEKTER